MTHLIAQALICISALLYLSGCTQVTREPAPVQSERPAESEPSAKLHYLESRIHSRHNQIPLAIASLEKAIQTDPDSAYLKRDRIRLILKLGEKDKALELAEILVKEHPKDIDNLMLLVRLKKEASQESGMQDLLRQILELDTRNKETYLRLGKIYMENQQFPEALELFTQMAKFLPDYYVSHFYLGEAHLLLKNHEAAQKEYQKTIALEPNLVEPRFRLIEIYQTQKSDAGYRKILEAYEKILEIEPGNDRAMLEMALLYQKNGNTKKADQLFSELGKSAQTSSRLVMVAVDTFLSDKRYDDAVIVFSKMLETNPDNDNLNFFLGMAYESKANLDKAIAYYLKVTPAHPQYKKTILTIAFLYRDTGKGKKAIQFLEQHHEKQPKDIDIISYLSSFYEGENLLDKAMALLKRGLEMSPDNTSLLFRLGTVQDKAGLKDDCIQTMEKIIRIDPGDASALNYLGYTYADMGTNLDEAEHLISKALKLKPEDGYITDSMGWVYYKKKNYEKAVYYLEKAARISKYETIIAGHLADAYAKSGRLPDALKTYHKAVTNAKAEDAELVKILKSKIDALEKQLEVDAEKKKGSGTQ